MQTIHLQNNLWEVEISATLNGRVITLIDRLTGIARVLPPDLAADYVAEGGHAPFFGLMPWTKAGDQPDPNTAVLSAFATIHGKPLDVRQTANGVRLAAKHAGLALTIEWSLPPGDEPLACRLTLVNESAPADDFQFEGFFIWRAPAEEWTDTCAMLPGLAPLSLKPYGEIYFVAGDGPESCAAWWTRGSAEGVAMRAGEGISRYFVGVQGSTFVLGPHSFAQRLAPGESLSCGFEIAPLAWASDQDWPCDIAAAECELVTQEARDAQTAGRIGSLAEWTAPASAPIARRAFHLTLQYGPSDLRGTIDLLEKIIAPAGYNQLMVEVDRAFPYRSHPKVAPDWAWSRPQWAEFLGAARSLGLEVIPQYNALAHQGESALTTAYPEMAEDAGGWCLCPQHPHTVPYLCDLFDELIDTFSPSIFHLGLDEVDVPSRPQTFCVCPKCKDADGGELFADHILGLHAHLATQGLEVMMWADMLFHRPEHNTVNGLRTGMWRAIDRLPRDIIMIDWVYSPVPAYGGTEYLLETGFRVMGATWHTPRAIADFSRYAAQRNLYGMCQTVWSGPTLREWPMVCVLLGGKYFQNPRLTEFDQTVAEAKALALALSAPLPA